MRKLLISTTALSVALSPVATFPAFAQTLAEDGSVVGVDGSVLCMPTADAACDLEAIIQAQQAAEAAVAAEAAAAEAEAAAQAAAAAAQAEADAAAQAAAEAEAAAAAQAEADAQAAAAAEAAAKAEAEAAAQAAAEAEAAAQAEADAAAQAAAEADAAAQAEAEAAAQAAADAEAASQAQDAAAAQAAAEAEAAAQASVEAEAASQAADEAGAEAAVEADAAAQPEAEVAADPVIEPVPEADANADAAAQADADAAAQAEADQAAADLEAALQAEADAAAQAEADAAAQAEADAAAQAEADPVLETEAEAEAEAAAEAETAAEPTEEVVAEPTEETAAEPTEEVVVEPTEEPVAEPTDEAVADVPADATVNPDTGEVVDPEADAAALAEAEAELAISDDGEIVDPAAGLRTAEPDAVESEPVDAPVVSEAEVESLTELLTSDPTAINPESLAAAATVAATDGEVEPAADGTVPPPVNPDDLIGSVTQTITEDSARTSSEEFAAAPRRRDDGRRSGLSDLEKGGLLVLGALAVGAIIKNNNEAQEDRRVVSNTGDRVVVLNPDGTYQVLKDDDTVIRRPGSTVRTETFRDGSTRTIVEREDGTQVVTIRDATGRVLRRATYDDLGRELVLIDDLQREEVVVVRDLPTPRSRIVISSKDDDAALKRELAALEADRAGRKFSLRQIREIPQVRALAAVIDTDNVTFASGSAAIPASEARDLADLGRVMQDLLDENPGEVFLVEGHTDATGKAAMNLALSDRRAESVALALTEYFDIPPENMVIQGYGETELLVDTQANEPLNRRVEVRVITPLMRTAVVQ
jgi:outer membrane protein OmpA-like peptidoglycan-associated protein